MNWPQSWAPSRCTPRRFPMRSSSRKRTRPMTVCVGRSIPVQCLMKQPMHVARVAPTQRAHGWTDEKQEIPFRPLPPSDVGSLIVLRVFTLLPSPTGRVALTLVCSWDTHVKYIYATCASNVARVSHRLTPCVRRHPICRLAARPRLAARLRLTARPWLAARPCFISILGIWRSQKASAGRLTPRRSAIGLTESASARAASDLGVWARAGVRPKPGPPAAPASVAAS